MVVFIYFFLLLLRNILYLSPFKYVRMGGSGKGVGTRQLQLRMQHFRFLHIFWYVMPMIAPWNFFLKDQVESTDSQEILLILCACIQFSLEVIVFLCGQNKRGCRNHLLTWNSPDDKNLVPVVLSLQWKDVIKSLDLTSFKKVFILTLP